MGQTAAYAWLLGRLKERNQKEYFNDVAAAAAAGACLTLSARVSFFFGLDQKLSSLGLAIRPRVQSCQRSSRSALFCVCYVLSRARAPHKKTFGNERARFPRIKHI